MLELCRERRYLTFCETEYESGPNKAPKIVRYPHECWRTSNKKSETAGFLHDDLLIIIDQEIIIKVIHLTREYGFE